MRVTNDLLMAADGGFLSILVLLDLSAAFVTISHNILMNLLLVSLVFLSPGSRLIFLTVHSTYN